jgi:hypothetical protein
VRRLYANGERSRRTEAGPTDEEARSVKNIQIIDGAENCVYDVFAATDEEFSLSCP